MSVQLLRVLWSTTAAGSLPAARNCSSFLKSRLIARLVGDAPFFFRISKNPVHASMGTQSGSEGASAPELAFALGRVGLGGVGLGWVVGIAVSCGADAVRMRVASALRSQRKLAACLAASIRRPRLAAQGLCTAQSWTRKLLSWPSRNRTSESV